MDPATILVVEDDDDIATLLTMLLSDEGYVVMEQHDGTGALAAAAKNRPDLVLLDLTLPDMDGFEVCRRLRDQEEGAYLPVIMLTARTDTNARILGIRSGADDYITKPFSAEELLLHVGLRLEHARRENEKRDAALRAGLQAIGQAVAVPITPEQLVGRLMGIMWTVLEEATCGILLWKEVEQCFRPAASAGLDAPQRRAFQRLRLAIDSPDELDRLIAEPQPLVLSRDSKISYAAALREAFEKETLLTAPILNENRLYGLLVVGRDGSPGEFRQSDIQLVASLADQTARALANRNNLEQLQRLAITDPLTGLHNLAYFHDFLATQLARGARSGELTALLMLDLDHLKAINDNYGHPAGDAAIIAVAEAMRQSVRESDIAARYGGDEFAIILPDSGREQALRAATRILRRVHSREVNVGDATLHLGVSIGVASTEQSPMDPHALIRTADRALYAAKEAGRNCIR